MPKRDIFVIGGSAGSSEPLRGLVAGLPKDFPGSLFVTTHIPSTHQSYLPEMLGQRAQMPVRLAVDGQPIERGCAYVAASDRHLLLIDSTIRLGLGPRENMARPSIDPMFRSAALSFGPRAVGVILSGMMNDGVAGLFAIKQAGGTAVVQHPLDAREESMPRASIEAVDVDYVARAAELPGVLEEVVQLEAGPRTPTSDSLALEVEIAAGRRPGSDALRSIAVPAAITCPDCGGVLSEVRGERPLRFRCQIGHAYTAEQLAARDEKLDEAIRVALRVMEERVELIERMARDARATGRAAVAELYQSRVEEYRSYAETLREAALLTLKVSREAIEVPF